MPPRITDRLVGDLPVTDAETAVEHVPPEATVAMSGIGAGPKSIPQALSADGAERSMRVLASADAGFIADTQLLETGGVAFRYPFAIWPTQKEAVNDGRVAFVDDHLSDVGRSIRMGQFGDLDVAIVEALAVGEDWFVPTTAVGGTPDFVAAADGLVLELNRGVPLAVQQFHDIVPSELAPRGPVPLDHPADRIGDERVRFQPSKLLAVVETDTQPMPYPFRERSTAERGIADRVVGFVSEEIAYNPVFADQLTVEVGVGTLGNDIMRRLGDLDVGDREMRYFGEVIQDGLLDLVDDGALTAASAMGLVLSNDGMNRLLSNPEAYTERIVTRPMRISNDPGLIRKFGVVAINNALEVDIYGNANASHIGGTDLAQGIGGSGDFARNGAVSIVVLPSVTSDGSISRIVPMVPHVDNPDHDVDVVITEQGVADLRGLPPRERARELIDACAHPDYRPDLLEYLERASESGGHIPHDLATAFDFHRDP